MTTLMEGPVSFYDHIISVIPNNVVQPFLSGNVLSILLIAIAVGLALFTKSSAVGNAGVPMGCFFLTVSLMTGIGAPVEVMGLILPIYTIIDMVETAENVWSDSCVCAMTDRDLAGKEG